MPESRFVSSSGTGLINPSSFVKLDTASAGGRVIQAGAGDKMFGIAQPGTRSAPFSTLDDGYAARNDSGQNDTVMVYTSPDKEVYLQIGTGGCNVDDFLKSSTLGVGVATTSTGDWVGARAKQSGIAGDLVSVDVFEPFQY